MSLPTSSRVPDQALHISSDRIARRERLRFLLRSPTFLSGAVLVVGWLACAVAWRLVVPFDPLANDLLAVLRSPSGGHWFGTDQLGRDVFSRVLAGSTGILVVAPAATALGTVLGTALGLLAGYRGSWVDDVIMRVTDAFLSVPVVILGLLALVALGPSTLAVIVVIGAVFAPIIARTVRAAVLRERDLDYVAAAQLRQESAVFIMGAEILPNVLPVVIVEFTVRLGYAIFTIATLSFLGFGIQPPAPDWGLQIFENYALISGGYWWPSLFPALAIASLVIGVNLLSDGVTSAYER